MEYNWCHGPNCHKRHTTNRVRGVKGSKVLRTRKIAKNNWNNNSYWQYFCDQTCLMTFMATHYPEMVRLHPRTEALETPIEDPKKITHTREGYYGNYSWTTTEIKKIDSGEQVG